MRYTIYIDELEKLLNQESKNIIILDVRTNRKDGEIPGTVPFDVDKHFSDDRAFYAEPEKIAYNLGQGGIDENMTLVFIDNGNYRPSAKALFALYQLGHQGGLHILQGGYPSWKERPIQFPKPRELKATNYKFNLRQDAVLSFADVQEQLKQASVSLVDSRSYERYAGIKEPKYAKAGHIPGAVNYHAKEVLDKTGGIHSKATLKHHFEALEDKKQIIVACGSGNSACVNAVALLEAGFTNVSLYPGGYGEWLEKGEAIETVEQDSDNSKK